MYYENCITCKNLLELLRSCFPRRVNTWPYSPLPISCDFTDLPCIVPQSSPFQDDDTWPTYLNYYGSPVTPLSPSLSLDSMLWGVAFTWIELVQSRSSNSSVLQGRKEESHHFKALKKKYLALVLLLCSTKSSRLWTHTCRISSSVCSAVFEKKMLAGTQVKSTFI